MDSTALIPLQYALDTFYFLICGALVMWMAAGFAMLESGLVRAKNTTEILTKNIVLYALACVVYLLLGRWVTPKVEEEKRLRRELEAAERKERDLQPAE